MKKEVDAVLTPAMRRTRAGLETHAVFAEIRDMGALRGFMQAHVYAVWDFMSLAKRLQRDLTCVTLPWMPPADPAAARLINDIVLAEESDVDAAGNAASHLDLYLQAMRDVGAPTRDFVAFLDALRGGAELEAAFDAGGTPEYVRAFVRHTLQTCLEGSTLQVMASFLYGRENVIPDMFQGLLEHWGLNAEQAPGFVYYLERHIELDGDAHGPAAERMLGSALARQQDGLSEARESAMQALQARMALWDGLGAVLRARREADAVTAGIVHDIGSRPGELAA